MLKYVRLLLTCCCLTAFTPCTDCAAAQTVPETARTDREYEMRNASIRINGREFVFKLYDTPAAREFAARLPLHIVMQDLNGNEKYHYLSRPLPARAQQVGHIRTGDVMLFGDDCLVVFYQSFSTSYAYTPLGRIENPAGLTQAAGKNSVTVHINQVAAKK